MCTGMGMTGIPQIQREIRGDGDRRCGNPAEMEVNLAGFPQE